MKVCINIDELAPEHQRTSCSDSNSNGNEYFNESGHPRCIRCALLFHAKYGEWPHKARGEIKELKLDKNR